MSMHLQLPGMPDIERLSRKLEARRASLADLCQLYRASSVLPRLEEALRCHEVRGLCCFCSGCVLSVVYKKRNRRILGSCHMQCHGLTMGTVRACQ